MRQKYLLHTVWLPYFHKHVLATHGACVTNNLCDEQTVKLLKATVIRVAAPLRTRKVPASVYVRRQTTVRFVTVFLSSSRQSPNTIRKYAITIPLHARH